MTPAAVQASIRSTTICKSVSVQKVFATAKLLRGSLIPASMRLHHSLGAQQQMNRSRETLSIGRLSIVRLSMGRLAALSGDQSPC